MPLYRILPRNADLTAIGDLWVASWQATIAAIDFEARRGWFYDYVAMIERRGGLTHCAHDEAGALAGFILLDRPEAVLEQIALAPKYFGSGCGAFLLDHAKSLCADGLSLTVNAENIRALRFYEKHGFVPIGESINPRSGLKIWLMRWRP